MCKLKPSVSLSTPSATTPTCPSPFQRPLPPVDRQGRSHLQGSGGQGGERRGAVLVLGSVRTADISLGWMEFSSSCACSSFRVPGDIRGTSVCVPVRSRPFSPPRKHLNRTPSPRLVPASPRGLNFLKFPQIHLYRSPVSHHRRTAPKVRRRSASVPDLRRRRERAGRKRNWRGRREMMRVGGGEGGWKRHPSISPVKGVATTPRPRPVDAPTHEEAAVS